MVRQFLQGQNFFLQEFGKMCSEVGWGLPQQVYTGAPGTWPTGSETEVVPLSPHSLLPAVLAARYIWLLSTAPPDHAWLWHQTLPDTETELELGQLLPSKQAPGVRVSGFGSHLALHAFPGS